MAASEDGEPVYNIKWLVLNTPCCPGKQRCDQIHSLKVVECMCRRPESRRFVGCGNRLSVSEDDDLD